VAGRLLYLTEGYSGLFVRLRLGGKHLGVQVLEQVLARSRDGGLAGEAADHLERLTAGIAGDDRPVDGGDRQHTQRFALVHKVSKCMRLQV
jgi:ribosomal protein L44E